MFYLRKELIDADISSAGECVPDVSEVSSTPEASHVSRGPRIRDQVKSDILGHFAKFEKITYYAPDRKRFKACRGTFVNALKELVDDGLIQKKGRCGGFYYVLAKVA